MNELTRRNRLEPLFDDMFKGFFVRPFSTDNGNDMAGAIRIDVKETGEAYTVHAEVPGVNKEDLNVDIDGNRVSISAEVKKASEQKDGEKVLRSERYYGQVARLFQLPVEVDEARATARYRDGVLELTLPKKTASSARKLTIE